MSIFLCNANSSAYPSGSLTAYHRLASAVVIFFNMPLRFLPPFWQFASSQSSNLVRISVRSLVIGSSRFEAVELRRVSKS